MFVFLKQIPIKDVEKGFYFGLWGKKYKVAQVLPSHDENYTTIVISLGAITLLNETPVDIFEKISWRCSIHKPVQHRDGREPWCDLCGLTKENQIPKSVFGDRDV